MTNAIQDKPDRNPSVLKIRSATINDAQVAEGRLPDDLYLDVLEAIAAEYFDCNAGLLIGDPVEARTLELQVNWLRDGDHCWSAWLDDTSGAIKPSLVWRYHGFGDRGPVHRAITTRIHEHNRAALEAMPLRDRADFVIRAALPTASAHLRLSLAPARAHLLSRAQDQPHSANAQGTE